jgi:hypothetical protein
VSQVNFHDKDWLGITDRASAADAATAVITAIKRFLPI